MDRYGIDSSQSENHISRDSFCDTYFFHYYNRVYKEETQQEEGRKNAFG